VAGFLLIPDYETATLFQMTNASLNDIPITVFLIVAGRRASRSFLHALASRL
jgi:hypothetical protein